MKGETGCCFSKPRRPKMASDRKRRAVETLISDIWLPELWDNQFLSLKPLLPPLLRRTPLPRLLHIVTAALGNSHRFDPTGFWRGPYPFLPGNGLF